MRTSRHPNCFVLRAVYVTLGIGCAGGALAHAGSTSENFDQEPAGWVGFNNEQGSSPNFGFRTSDKTGQESPGGEVGGRVARSALRDWYADPNLGGIMTEAFALHGSGELFVENGATADNGTRFAHFNTNNTNAPPRENIIGFGILEGSEGMNSTHFRFTASLMAADGQEFRGDRIQAPYLDGGGNPIQYKFSYDWDPQSATLIAHLRNPDGSIVATSEAPTVNNPNNSNPFVGFQVNAWGMGFGANSSPNNDQYIDAYIDAVTYTTIVPGPKLTQTFDGGTAPSNWVRLADPTFGFSNTNNTGQESPEGEAGGTIHRDNVGRAYADISIGQIIQAQPFGAAGEFFFGNAVDPNTELLIGHFAQDQIDGSSTQDPSLNKAGLYILDDGDGFRFLTRMYTSEGTRLDGNVVSLPAGQYKFDYVWDPDSFTLSARMLDPDGVTVLGTSTQTVDPGTTFTLDAFGLVVGFTGAPNAFQESFDVFVDNLTYTIGAPATGSQWNVDDEGNWSFEGNWIGGVPNGVGSLATFGSIITDARTVTLDAPHTVGGITFDNANSYTISGTNTLTISGAGASLKVLSGSHSIAAPIVLDSNTSVDVAAGQTLSVQHLRGASLSVNTGTLRVIPGGTPNSAGGTSKVISLSIASGATLDLTNNSAIIDYSGDVGTLVDDIRQHLSSGRLTSSSATLSTRLGYGDNAILGLGSFGGQSVDDSSVLVKFTYAGDADLNGQVDVADLGRLASNWQTSGPWTSGDFDYSGFVDVADLGLLASNWQSGVGSPLGPSFAEALASLGLGNVAVPEPTCAAVMLLVPLLGRRGRRDGALR